jgi:hypothetical protein
MTMTALNFDQPSDKRPAKPRAAEKKQSVAKAAALPTKKRLGTGDLVARLARFEWDFEAMKRV